MTVRSLESVHRLRYFRFCNVLHTWTIRAIPTYMYRFKTSNCHCRNLHVDTTSTQSGTFQNGRLHTSTRHCQKSTFLLLSFFFQRGYLDTRSTTGLHLHINSLHFLARSARYHNFQNIITSPKRHYFGVYFLY